MVEWIPNFSYRSQHPMINALINYLKDMTIINNDRTLDVNSMDIHLEPNSAPLSVKQLFSTMINDSEFNTSRQQDAGEGLIKILQYIESLGLSERDFINPFRFCKFESRDKKIWVNCPKVAHFPNQQENILQFYAPEDGHFDMNQFVTSKLQEEELRLTLCEDCGCVGAKYNTELIETQKVMIIQINFFDNFLRKKPSTCIPLQNLDINVNGQTKKYELHNIIQHIGDTLQSGHYKSYFKKNNTWYCANDTEITTITTENLPNQPYINIYKEAQSVSETTVEPSHVQEIRIAESQILCLCNSSNHLCRKCEIPVCNFCGERDPSSDNEMHIMHKENDTRCKVGEIEIERQRRLNRQKEYEHNRFTKTRERAKKVQEVREKRLAESEKEKERRLNYQKEYDHKKRLAESEKEKERRLTQKKEYQRQKRRQPIKDWEQQLIDKASLTHICTSECRYRH